MAAQDSNPGSLRRESDALPLSHCTTILNDEVSKIERDLCVFGSTERECPSSYLLALIPGYIKAEGIQKVE